MLLWMRAEIGSPPWLKAVDGMAWTPLMRSLSDSSVRTQYGSVHEAHLPGVAIVWGESSGRLMAVESENETEERGCEPVDMMAGVAAGVQQDL